MDVEQLQYLGMGTGATLLLGGLFLLAAKLLRPKPPRPLSERTRKFFASFPMEHNRWETSWYAGHYTYVTRLGSSFVRITPDGVMYVNDLLNVHAALLSENGSASYLQSTRAFYNSIKQRKEEAAKQAALDCLDNLVKEG